MTSDPTTWASEDTVSREPCSSRRRAARAGAQVVTVVLLARPRSRACRSASRSSARSSNGLARLLQPLLLLDEGRTGRPGGALRSRSLPSRSRTRVRAMTRPGGIRLTGTYPSADPRARPAGHPPAPGCRSASASPASTATPRSPRDGRWRRHESRSTHAPGCAGRTTSGGSRRGGQRVP